MRTAEQTPGLGSSVWLALVPPPQRRKALLAVEQELPEIRNLEPGPVVWFVVIKGTCLGELEGKVKAPAVFSI